MLNPFTPGVTVALAAGTVSGRVALGLPTGGKQVMISNLAGGDNVFVKFGDATVVASVVTDMPIPAGQTIIFTVPTSATHIAGVTGTTTAAVYITSGQGS